MIIVIGGIKGGAGKSTIAANLAARRATEYNVLLVDGDEQETTRQPLYGRQPAVKISRSRIQILPASNSEVGRLEMKSLNYPPIIKMY